MSNHDGLLVWPGCCTKAPDDVPESIQVCQYLEYVQLEDALLCRKCE